MNEIRNGPFGVGFPMGQYDPSLVPYATDAYYPSPWSKTLHTSNVMKPHLSFPWNMTTQATQQPNSFTSPHLGLNPFNATSLPGSTSGSTPSTLPTPSGSPGQLGQLALPSLPTSTAQTASAAAATSTSPYVSQATSPYAMPATAMYR